MEEQLVDLLIQKNWTIASAESCTGGLFSATIINVPNASKVINSSIVTYSNQAKQKFCNVKEQTLIDFGAVSEQVAGQMAQGICNTSESNVGVGISGLAGPGGATLTKPVGMVCFGFCVNGKVETYTQYFSGNRNEVRKQSVDFAMNKLIEIIANN